MQAQDSTSFYLLELWSWAEANKTRLIAAGVAVAILALVVSFFVWQHDQKEINAGQALTQLTVNPGSETAEAYFKIAAEYPGTMAAQRALLQGAGQLYGSGQYADAQAQFQKFLDAHPESEFAAQAALGVASCLEAQNKYDLASTAYGRVINMTSDPSIQAAAKFAMAQIYESQGHYNEAASYYEDVARQNPNSPMGSEAGLRLVELENKIPTPAPAQAPAAAPAKAPVVPFKLTE
jgi:TolA-binding protein